MKLPDGERAIVDERKVRDYLLSVGHPVGRFKAAFFAGLGFGSENWHELSEAIMTIAASGEAELVQETEHGRKYLVLGTLSGPVGRSAEVVTVWIVGVATNAPRLVTVYPR